MTPADCFGAKSVCWGDLRCLIAELSVPSFGADCFGIGSTQIRCRCRFRCRCLHQLVSSPSAVVCGGLALSVAILTMK